MRKVSRKLVVIYSDQAGARLGAEIADTFRRGIGSNTHLMESAWKTELLKSRKLRLIAAREAAEAEAVIVSAREGTPLPPEVFQCLRLWRKQRKAGSPRPTLIVLLTRPDAVDQPIVQEALHAFAISAKVNFFCHSKIEKPARRWAETCDEFDLLAS